MAIQHHKPKHDGEDIRHVCSGANQNTAGVGRDHAATIAKAVSGIQMTGDITSWLSPG